ncbi:MAG: DUF4147 domain-containing protein, partial [Bdellovibrionota bacterium]|nr:DUF4147 domain-containing protein [Bdellovibrionota bacterium]
MKEKIQKHFLLEKIFEQLSADLFFEDIDEEINSKSELFGLGKTALPLTQCLRKKVMPQNKAIVFSKYGVTSNDKGIKLVCGGHPYPDNQSFENGKLLQSLLNENMVSPCLFLCLTGGASSVIDVLPEGIGASFVMAVHRELLHSGATIEEVNELRQELSLLKNGGLLSLSTNQVFHTFITSDIPSQNYKQVGSSPSFYTHTETDHLKKLAFSFLREDLREKVIKFIDSPLRKKICIDKERAYKEKKSYLHLVCDYGTLMKKLKDKLDIDFLYRESPFNHIMEEGIKIHLEELRDFKKKGLLKNGFTWITGGETPVRVQGKGKGGRNTEFVLRISKEIFGKNVLSLELKDLKKVWIASFATDGTDGDTSCAGAWIDYETYQTSLSLRPDVDQTLDNNDSYTFLKKLGNLIETGPGDVNIMDLRVIQLA